MKHLVIFDFDDTIVDNSLIDYMAFKIPSISLGISYPSKKNLVIYRKKGLLAKDIIQKFTNIDNKTLKHFLELRKSFLKEKSTSFLTLRPYLKNTLKKLQMLNIKVVICSANSSPANIIQFLNKNNLLIYFSKIYTIKNLNFKLNNSSSKNRILIKTSLLKLIINQNALLKFDMIYIGNSIDDFISANSHKIDFIFIKSKYLSIPTIKNMKKISSLNQIIPLIGVNIN